MASPIYMKVTGPNGSVVKGDVAIKGLEGMIEVRALRHEVALPEYLDGHLLARTNIKQGDGHREHGCVKLLKRIDPATPAFYKYVCGGKNTLLQSVELNHFRRDDEGEENVFYTITLEEVKVVSVKAQTEDVFGENSRSQQPHLEEVALRYGKIIWDFEQGKYSHSDAWDKRA